VTADSFRVPATRRLSAVWLTVILGITFVGFVVGINDGVPREDPDRSVVGISEDSHADESLATADHTDPGSSSALPASWYFEMRQADVAKRPTPSLARIHEGSEFQRCVSCHDPHTLAVGPSQQDKSLSLSVRASRRAFNGAPPVIPHAVDGTNDAACYACHGDGAVIGGRIANRMSHGPLANCLQCHAAPPPPPFADLVETPINAFVGLPAPIQGPRAFDGAPPLVPHSTWMREECLSCHGGLVPGLEVTHRWRTNCLQCHGTSMRLEQGIAAIPFPHR